MAAIHRTVDTRKAATLFIQQARRILRDFPEMRRTDPMGVVTRAHSHSLRAVGDRAYRSFDSARGVVVVTNLSDLPHVRHNVRRILGVDRIEVVQADSFGTVYTPKGT